VQIKNIFNVFYLGLVLPHLAGYSGILEVRTNMANLKAPIIAASIAVVAVIITIVVLASGGSASGIYVSGVTGSVSVSDNDGNAIESADLYLKQGDIITVGPNSSCTITYKGKNNSEENYIVLGSNTQVIVNSKFSGGDSGELFLNRGNIITNLVGKSKGEINIRTANSMVYVQNTVSKVSSYEKDNRTYTDVVDFMSTSMVELYDLSGNADGKTEPLLEKRAACIITGDEGPYFEYLNQDFSLSILSAEDLKSIITIAQLEGELFPYSVDVLREAYTAASKNLPPDSITSSLTSEPVITAVPIESSDVETATTVPPAVTDAPPNTSLTVPTVSVATRPQTAATTAATTAAPATTIDSSRMLTVILVIGDDESINEVPYGGSLDKPDDPVLDGYTFAGWEGSFTNITEDCTITAKFTPNEGTPIPDPSSTPGDDTIYHTVTVVVAGQSRTIQVRDGDSANLQTNVQIDGYRFLGWDRDFTNITENCTITALLEPVTGTTAASGKHIVTFVIEGIQYPVEVEHGGTAVPPFYPTPDAFGNPFQNWDKPTSNITADVTITAVYQAAQLYTVTFSIDGNLYYVEVRAGETAVPPFTPGVDMFGRTFVGWDKSLYNITSNQVITALYQ
jgi:uncharacterized protein YqfB (UPF0267 family)